MLEYVEAHRPAGTSESLCGPSTTNGVIESECAYFAWPQVPGTLTMRWLVVEVVQLPDGATGLRADAEVVWVTPRPASETVPAGARLLRISVSSSIKANQPRQRPLTVTSATKIAKVTALINALPAAQPGRSRVRSTSASTCGSRSTAGVAARRWRSPTTIPAAAAMCG